MNSGNSHSKNGFALIVITLLALMISLPAVEISSVVRDTAGEPLAGILVRASSEGRESVTSRTDARNWEPLGTVLLMNPPLRLVDPDTSAEKAFYRAVPAGEIILREQEWQVTLQNFPGAG